MKDLTVHSIAKAVKGTCYVNGEILDFDSITKDSPDYEKYYVKTVSHAERDSHEIGKDGLFFAIKGTKVDGHDFIPEVYEAGAMLSISEKILPGQMHPYILVESTLQAIKDLAEFYRSRLNVTVVGITGSTGKTCTKETVACVLSEKYKVLKTIGNYNNEIGVPLTIFRLREDDEIAVLEMGISDFGEMTRLAKIARPDYCIITNIGLCYLEKLQDRDGILKAKSEIFQYLSPKGNAILNGDDDKLLTVSKVNDNPIVYFGKDEKNDVYADEINDLGLEGVELKIHIGIDGYEKSSFFAHVPVPGIHMVNNAVAAAAVATLLGLSADEIKAGLEKFENIGGRSKVICMTNRTVIDDTYSANPVSMQAALNVLSKAKTRKVAILGDMFELGENEKNLHYEMGSYVAIKNPDLLITVGTLSLEIAKGAKDHGFERVISYPDLDSLLENLESHLKEGDTILAKASHNMNFARIAEKLCS